MIDQGILYDYKPYAQPLKGLFTISGDTYGPYGWNIIEKIETIIGEDTTAYITHLKPTGHGEYEGDRVVQYKYVLPLGIHKSRLIRWLDSPQLKFNL